jgi:hypothetical protein
MHFKSFPFQNPKMTRITIPRNLAASEYVKSMGCSTSISITFSGSVTASYLQQAAISDKKDTLFS